MTIGQGGKYDPETAALLVALQARGVILVVVDGIRGSGFSVAMQPDALVRMPEMLESIAEQMRKDIASLGEQREH